MSKPTDLIVANVIHDMATLLERPRGGLLGAAVAAMDEAEVTKNVMQGLLMTIAKDGSMASVRKALDAIGAPSDPAEIEARLKAAREQIRELDGTPETAKDSGLHRTSETVDQGKAS